MQRRPWAFLIPIALVLAAAMSGSHVRHPSEAVTHQCLEIHADNLPRDVRVRHIRQDGPDLVVYVYHLDWTAEIRCVLYRDGLLDEVGTLNRKDRVLWAEPPMPSNP
jgi:hypothetical protein